MKRGLFHWLEWLRTSATTLFLPVLISSCGTNTHTPVYPIFSSVVSIGTPAIIDLQPITITSPPEFQISFYVTNQEDDFIGYNLYITKNYVAGDVSLAGLAGQPYLPSGVEPSFPYSKSDASTKAADLKTQTIVGFKPPPSPIFFQYCRYYYFALSAVIRNGTRSPPSPQVSACILDTFDPVPECPTTASCK